MDQPVPLPMAPRAQPNAAMRPSAASGEWTVKDRDARAEQRVARLVDIRAAAVNCHATGVGDKTAMATGLFPLATRNTVRGELQEGVSDDYVVRDAKQQVLTNDEGIKLAHWVLGCADAHEPVSRHQMSVKAREIPRERH